MNHKPSLRKRHIIAEAESRGWTILHIEWEPLGISMEKAGPGGGWQIDLERDGKIEWAGGYNAAQAVQWIKNLDDGWSVDPFSCCGKVANLGADDCLMARGHKGDCETKRTRGLVA